MAFNNDNSKMITVRSRGYVHTSRGMVMAPIRTPYREYIERIWSMITNDRAEIYERLKNGKDIRLTVQNFDMDNNNNGKEANAAPSLPAVPNNPVVQQQNVQSFNQNNNQNQGGNGKKNKKNKNKWYNQNQAQTNEFNQVEESKNGSPVITEQDGSDVITSEESIVETSVQTVKEEDKIEETKELTPKEKKEESAALAVDIETA